MSGVLRTEKGRNGTATSCAECKRRKIRCRWPATTSSTSTDETGLACSNCIARGKRCVPQSTSLDVADTNPTARDRIATLESQVAELNELVKTPQPGGVSNPDGVDANVALPSDDSQLLWHTICAVDRFNSMSANPPSDKPGRTFLSDLPVFQHGHINVPAIIYQLSEIYFRIHKTNKITPNGAMWMSYEEVVQNINRDLHALADQLPGRWWLEYESISQPERLVQFWHFYLLALLHLRNALSDDNHNRFAYNRERFHSASRGAVIRYLNLRNSSAETLLPISLDIQAFAVTSFLLLTSHSPRGDQELDEDLKTLYLVHRVVDTFKLCQPGSDIARRASQVLTSLHDFFAGQESEQPFAATLRLPFLGSIAFKRASLLLGVGDEGLTFLPWSFDIDLSQPWPQEIGFEQRLAPNET